MTYHSYPTYNPERQKVVPKNAVVLDPGQFNSTTTQVVKALRSVDPLLLGRLDLTLPYIAGQIEAQTKPPRIPEPGKYGVVEASVTGGYGRRLEWVNEGKLWRALDTGERADWDEFVSPALVREGISA